MRIFFGTINLNQQVHAQAFGFTSHLYAYAWAATPEEASSAMHRHYTARGCDVRNAYVNVHTAPATEQKLSRYTFPEQIIDLPADVLAAEYERRDYPADWRVAGYSSRVQGVAA